LSRTKQSQAHKENIKQQDQAFPYIYKLKKKATAVQLWQKSHLILQKQTKGYLDQELKQSY
jgi:hypothetical protein